MHNQNKASKLLSCLFINFCNPCSYTSYSYSVQTSPRAYCGFGLTQSSCLLANTNLIFILGQTSSYLVFWGGFRKYSLCAICINTSYLTNSYIIFTFKMESVSKNTIFGLKMMVKSGLEKIFLKFLHAGDYFLLLHKCAQIHKFSNKNNYLPAWRDFKIIFLGHFSLSFLGQK